MGELFKEMSYFIDNFFGRRKRRFIEVHQQMLFRITILKRRIVETHPENCIPDFYTLLQI